MMDIEATKPKRKASAVTSGRRLMLDHADRRSASYRRFKDVFAAIISDLGGADAGLSEGQRQLARRAATIAVRCEEMEQSAISGGSFDLDAYGRATGNMRRAFETLGLRRVPRDITPDLQDYLNGKADEVEAAEESK
jgi:hypothetical protein